MKTSTLHSLITAKTVFNASRPLIQSGNTHSCSAGLVLLQDALELIVIAVLGELGVDDEKSLDRKSFDELLGELKNTGTPVPKSGTMKALNKQRVIIKHYGQLAEPATVKNYFESASEMIDAALRHTIGKPLDEVLLTDLLPACEAKDLLSNAIDLKINGDFLGSLIEIRKAFYVEYEFEYAIHKWFDADVYDGGLLQFLGRGGQKAPDHTKNPSWIQENVRCPTDYVQINHQQIRIDALEWGVSTSSVDNLRRLTPSVFRAGEDSAWCVSYEMNFPPNEANESNCNYCLDTTISILLKKREHENIRRWPRNERPFVPPAVYLGHSVFKLARADADVVHTVQQGYEYTVYRLVSGFNEGEQYFYLTGVERPDEENPYGKNPIVGYLRKVEE